MNLYGIKVVPAEWELDMPIPFTQAEHELARDTIENGTRVLVFKGSPVNALVAEGEVHGFFIRPAEWTASATDGLPPSIANADYLLTLGVLMSRSTDASMFSLEEVRRALDDSTFPRRDGEWRPLDDEHYRRLIRDWP